MPKSKKAATKTGRTISIDTVKRVAAIARLELSDSELHKFRSDLNNILDAFQVLDEADVRNVEPSFQPLPVKDVVRNDEIESYLSREKALENTRHKHEGHFKGPRVV